MGGNTGTVGVADLYGRPSRTNGALDPLGITNPNSNGVAPATQQASGAGGGVTGGSGPAIAWVGLVVTLVLIRVAVHALEAA